MNIQARCQFENAAGNGIICYLRTYGDNESFIGAVGKISDNIAGYYFVSGNDSSSNIGISDTIKIHRRENSSAIKLRIAFAYENKTTPITPSDLEGRVITVDGVSYTLVAGE